MNAHVAGSLGRTFRVSTQAAAYREALRRHQAAEQERRERKQEDMEQAESLMDLAMAMVSSGEIDAFRLDLDRYDTATITALEQNSHDIELARQRLDDLLLKAHVLPDGRRVFKTEDGTRVFDENGAEVDASIIDPDLIDEFRPRWEVYKPELINFRNLTAERLELLSYQQKLDAARERLDQGDLSRDEFDRLRDDLKADMPSAVRTQFPELALDDADRSAAATADSDPQTPGADLVIDDDMVPLALARGHVPTPP